MPEPVEKTTMPTKEEIQAKMNALAASFGEARENINCLAGSICDVRAHTEKLQKIYKATKRNMQLAPLELSLAEKNIYEYNNGESGGDARYQALIIDRFATTAQELQQNSVEKQQEYMSDLAQALRQYQAQQLFAIRTNELLKTRIKDNTDLKKKLEVYHRILHTSQRKVVYENKDMSNIYMWRRVMLFFYYGAIIVYIIFGNFIPDKLYTQYSVWLLIVIACIVPVILNILMKWLFVIGDVISYWFMNDMPHRDVYAKLKDSDTDSITNGFNEANSPPGYPAPLEPLGTPMNGSSMYTTLGMA